MNRRSDMRRGDRRNPYGSRGGYVTSRRSMRDRRDREDMRRDRRDMGYDERERRFEGHYGDTPFEVREREDYGYENDMARRRDRRGRYMSDRDMARGGNRGGRGGDRADYGDYNDYEDYGDYNDYGAEPLSEKELKEWAEEMKEDVESNEKQILSMEHIKKKAEEMGMEFEKFSPIELYVATVMMYTDYHKTLGGGNIDIFIRLAHDWLKDKDSGLKYGEKLDAYYEYVICGNE